MKLDKSKKYEFCGEVYEWGDVPVWRSETIGFTDKRFQLFADHDHVTGLREPLVFEGEVRFYGAEHKSSTGIIDYRDLPEPDRNRKTFRVTWTEVVK